MMMMMMIIIIMIMMMMMMVMMIITTIITIIIIIIIIIIIKKNNSNKNSIQRRNSRFLQSPHLSREPSPTRTLKWQGRNRVQITCHTPCADHVQHVVLRATWYEGTAQLLSLTELKSHLFELYFIG